MLNNKGTIVWRVLFGVVMAGLLLGIFFVYTASQREYAVGDEAQALADDLSQTAFSSLPDQQQSYGLPKAVGTAGYEVDVENNTFIVRILGGGQKGKEYRSSLTIDLEVENSLPEPGNTLYIQGRVDNVILSASPIETPEKELVNPASFEPPDFYEFAKENSREATGIIASYFYAKNQWPDAGNIDIRAYEWSENTLKTAVTSEDGLSTSVLAHGKENQKNVGYIENVWTVIQLETSENGISNPESCPSIKNAYSDGWLYSPTEKVTNFQGRTWKSTEDNKTIIPPNNLDPHASTVTTNVSTYPSWRFKFTKNDTRYTVHLAAIPWSPSENQPGFVFESSPDLEAIR